LAGVAAQQRKAQEAAQRKAATKTMLVSSIIFLLVAVLVIFSVYSFLLKPASGQNMISAFAGKLHMTQASENAGIKAVRTAKLNKLLFSTKIKSISDAQLEQSKADIAAFMASGASYRAAGKAVVYTPDAANPLTAGANRISLDIEMSYNAGLHVYTFKLDGYCDDDTRLQQYLGIEDTEGTARYNVTFYAVIEDGNTRVFWDDGAKKGQYQPGTRTDLYNNFLKRLFMENLITLDYLNTTRAYSGEVYDGFRYITNRNDDSKTWGYGTYNKNTPGYELRTYKDKPVSYYYCKDLGNGLIPLYQFDFYYDKIPEFKPEVEGWK
jgi:hypothetical protein